MTADHPELNNSTNQSPRDHANVVVRPPILWILLLTVGYGLDLLLPLPFLPSSYPTVWIGSGIFLVGIALAGVAGIQFRRAGTDIQTHTPTATIVDTGVFAFSRNPIYLGAHIGTVGVAIALNSLWVLATLVPFDLIIETVS